MANNMWIDNPFTKAFGELNLPIYQSVWRAESPQSSADGSDEGDGGTLYRHE